jgi:hypothetical protein
MFAEQLLKKSEMLNNYTLVKKLFFLNGGEDSSRAGENPTKIEDNTEIP